MKALLLALALIATPLGAATGKPLRVIVAFSAGGVTDIIARALMPRLGERWGDAVVVENRRCPTSSTRFGTGSGRRPAHRRLSPKNCA